MWATQAANDEYFHGDRKTDDEHDRCTYCYEDSDWCRCDNDEEEV